MAVAALTLIGIGVGTAVAVTSMVGPAAEAGAEPIGSCSTTTGVIVVVDFAHWGGKIERGCTATPTTGYQALHTAGFTTAGDDYDGPAFMCRIDTKPTPTQTPCVNTPPASAYWSYWHADAGQSTWTYSQLGPMTYKPPPGSVTAWVFGGTSTTGTAGTGRPLFTPKTVRATNTTQTEPGSTTTTSPPTSATTAPSIGPTATNPTATTSPPAVGSQSPTTKPGSGSTAKSSTSTPSKSGGKATAGAGGKGSTTTSSTTTPGSSATTAPSSTGGAADKKTAEAKAGGRSGSSPKIVDVVPASSALRASPGSPLPLVIGVVVVVALAGSGGFIAWRRRRAS